jgi:hypothetical protein
MGISPVDAAVRAAGESRYLVLTASHVGHQLGAGDLFGRR